MEAHTCDSIPNSANIINLNLFVSIASEAQRQPEDVKVGSSGLLAQPPEVSPVDAPEELAHDLSQNFWKDGRPSGTPHDDQQAKVLAHEKAVNWEIV